MKFKDLYTSLNEYEPNQVLIYCGSLYAGKIDQYIFTKKCFKSKVDKIDIISDSDTYEIEIYLNKKSFKYFNNLKKRPTNSIEKRDLLHYLTPNGRVDKTIELTNGKKYLVESVKSKRKVITSGNNQINIKQIKYLYLGEHKYEILWDY